MSVVTINAALIFYALVLVNRAEVDLGSGMSVPRR